MMKLKFGQDCCYCASSCGFVVFRGLCFYNEIAEKGFRAGQCPKTERMFARKKIVEGTRRQNVLSKHGSKHEQ